MISNANPTELRLFGIGVPPYSARGLSQSFEPIDMAQQIARSINGRLMDLSYAPMRKYKSTVSGSDQTPPACDGVWPGQLVEVDCIFELCHADGQPFGRAPVDYDEAIRVSAGFVFYRPHLEMMVIGFSIDTDEYGAQVGWKLELEEA